MSAVDFRYWHQKFGADFMVVNGVEVVVGYGNLTNEHAFLQRSAAVIDLSSRGRLSVTGADRMRFVNGQVSNNVQALKTGQGCYAALTNAKGKMQADLNLFALPDEYLLDLEPGLGANVQERLEKYVIADDVQVVDASAEYGLLSVQGPRAEETVKAAGFEVPERAFDIQWQAGSDGEIYWAKNARLGSGGFDFFVPRAAMESLADQLRAACQTVEGGLAGWRALEIARIEASIPRFGADMDESNLPPEAGLEGRAVSYTKGCYIGQEVIARIRTYGQVAKTLRALRLADDLPGLPVKGDKLCREGREVGYITSAIRSLAFSKNIALGYVRREANPIGTKLSLRTAAGESPVEIAGLPFEKNFT